jgi:uncharacterized membrane protein YczE
VDSVRPRHNANDRLEHWIYHLCDQSLRVIALDPIAANSGSWHGAEYDHLALRITEAISGVIITGFGGGVYLIAKLGPGPRDGLMTGLQSLTNFPIAWVRSAIELTVVVIGFFLGGVVGIGTLLFAFGIGPCVAAALYGLQWVFAEENSRQKSV